MTWFRRVPPSQSRISPHILECDDILKNENEFVIDFLA